MNTPLQKELDWYKDAVIYELHIKGFRDGDGDGIGDFKGLLEKLDYLQDLGVTAIWLLPFYPSPQKDDGYDISDYYSINPAYGDLKEFQLLLGEAHRRKLKIIIELVINHTSKEHPWFQQARNAPKDSPERNFYVWSDDPNKYPDVRIIFQDFESSNWTFDPIAQQYYWHRFFQHQPDLNYDNPAVQAEVFKILEFWCKMGVDGFRLDAVPYLFEKEGTNGENLPATHAFLKRLRKHVDTYYPGTLLLAEANMWPEDSASYFGSGDECQMNYHFPVMPRLFMSVQMEDRYPITDIFEQTPAIPDNCQWAIFLRNHDELTLEMVTDEERDYMYKVYVKDPKARINLGIRHRLAPLLGNSRQKIELLNFLLFSLPGTPVLYYGDEIGMGDNFYLGDRNGVRTPMQWSADRNAGFSEANPQKLYLPIILDPAFHYEAVNVDIQQQNTSSLLWWMKRVISKRKEYKVFGRGDLKFVNCPNAKILAFTRSYQDQSLLVVVNLSRHTQPAELDLKSFKGYRPIEIFSLNKFPLVTEPGYFLTLSAYSCEWFLLEKTSAVIEDHSTLPNMIWNDWNALSEKETLEHLEHNILPSYMLKVRWFGGKARVMDYFRIIKNTVVDLEDRSNAHFLLIEVKYENGLMEMYQLALTVCKTPADKPFQTKFPQAILATLKVGDEAGVLMDAFYDTDFQHKIITNIFSAANQPAADGNLKFFATELFKDKMTDQEELSSKILSADQSNTCILYGDRFFLKLFRKVDYSVNPDVEITEFLTKKKFENIPAFLGSVEWSLENGKLVLGMLQEQVKHSSDGWVYIMNQLNQYYEKILARKGDDIAIPSDIKSLMEPIGYDEFPEEVKDLLDGQLAEQVRILGIRTAQMHQALAAASEGDDATFQPETYTLHYQRSLYAGLQSLVRTTFQNLEANVHRLEKALCEEATEIIKHKNLILDELKKIYEVHINAIKIRIHGDYHLGQVLFTGKDFIITDFEGEPARSFSERKLKRSPLKDVAGMIRSFHYAAYGAIMLGDKTQKQNGDKLSHYAGIWYHYMTGVFLKSYLETTAGSNFIPHRKEEVSVLLRTFLLEKAIYEVNYEINNRPTWVGIPLMGIRSLLTEAQKLVPVDSEAHLPLVNS